MLDKQAIEHIQSSELVKNQLDNLKDTDAPVIIVPDSFKIESLESLMPNRASFRGIYRTESIDDFIEYVGEHEKQGNKCFIDSEKMSALAFIDLGTEVAPGHARHKAYTQVKRTAAFSALERILGSRLSQLDLSDFVEDWRDNLLIQDSAQNPINIQQAINAIRNITIDHKSSVSSEVGEMSASKTGMESIEARNKDQQPAYFTFTCIPYHGLKERAITMKMSINTGGNTPTLTLRAIGLEALREEMAIEFKGLLDAGFSDKEVLIYLGSFDPSNTY